MKLATSLLLGSIALLMLTLAQAEVAGSTVLGVSVMELRDITQGWSVKHQVLGKDVFNDKKERIGKADDVIIAPDLTVSYVIIGAGGFLGVGKHDVAIPVGQMKEVDGKFVLEGATKDSLKAMPPFEYAH